jgi:hypothetical protein
VTQAKYLADLLALQVLNTNVAHHINRGDCDALADYLSMTPSMKRTREHQKGAARSLHGFVLALTRIKRLRATFIVQSMLSLSIRSSREEVVYECHISPGNRRTSRALASPIVYDVDDVYQLGLDERCGIACRTEKSVR